MCTFLPAPCPRNFLQEVWSWEVTLEKAGRATSHTSRQQSSRRSKSVARRAWSWQPACTSDRNTHKCSNKSSGAADEKETQCQETPYTHYTTTMYNEQHTQKVLQAACMCVSLTLTLSLLSSAGRLTSLDPPTGQEQCLSCQHQPQCPGSTQLSSSSSSTGVEQSPGQ